MEPQVNENHKEKFREWTRDVIKIIDDLECDVDDYIDIFFVILLESPVERKEELMPIFKRIMAAQREVRDKKKAPKPPAKPAPKSGIRKPAAKKSTTTCKRASKAKSDNECIVLSVGEWRELYKAHHEDKGSGPCATCEDANAERVEGHPIAELLEMAKKYGIGSYGTEDTPAARFNAMLYSGPS